MSPVLTLKARLVRAVLRLQVLMLQRRARSLEHAQTEVQAAIAGAEAFLVDVQRKRCAVAMSLALREAELRDAS